MYSRALLRLYVVVVVTWACNDDGPSGTEFLPPDLRGTWFAVSSIVLTPVPTTTRFCEDGAWIGTLEIFEQNGSSFAGILDADFEESSTECAQEFALQETVTGSVTVNGDVRFVIGSLVRMGELIEAVTRCSTIPPIQEFSGFAGEVGQEGLVERDILGISVNTVQCLPESEDTPQRAGFGLLATDQFPPNSAQVSSSKRIRKIFERRSSIGRESREIATPSRVVLPLIE